MNTVWQFNIELGGKCREYSFECNEKTWHTDGLLENVTGRFLEVVAGEYDDRVLTQIEAYLWQLARDRSLSKLSLSLLRTSVMKEHGRRLSIGNFQLAFLYLS
jgi:hypothetical protein